MIYLIKENKDTSFKEVSKDQYLYFQRKAGFYIGDNIIVPSFYSKDYNLSGKIN